VRGGREIIRRFQPDVIVLDDGFQHRKLARDLNIAVINGKVGFGNGYLLPAGPLREPVSALGRANLIWFNQATQADVAKNFQQKIAQFSKSPCIYSNYVVSGVTTIPVREHFSPELLKQKKIFAFSGIANPARFKASLLETGPSFVELMTFPDHHSFSAADLDKIGQRIGRLNPDFVLTTEKDAMRLPAGIPFANKLYFLEIKVVVNNEDMLENILKNQVV
jgi:tetraacyldisaccharide 4'-kinase